MLDTCREYALPMCYMSQVSHESDLTLVASHNPPFPWLLALVSEFLNFPEGLIISLEWLRKMLY